jgi:hypothetical protein
LKDWDTFAEICGAAAATLTGLLFVAVSIKIASIAKSQELRNRAAQTLSLFGIVLIISALIAIPGQGYRALRTSGMLCESLPVSGDRYRQSGGPESQDAP